MTWDEFIATCIPTPHYVAVEMYAGAGGYGDVHDEPIQIGPCVVEDTTRAVTVQTVEAEGSERLSSTTVYAPLEPAVTPGSRVTLPWRTGAATVLAVARLDAHGHALPEHQELSLE